MKLVPIRDIDCSATIAIPKDDGFVFGTVCRKVFVGHGKFLIELNEYEETFEIGSDKFVLQIVP